MKFLNHPGGNFLIEEKDMKKGDRIAILSHNSLEFIVLLFAIAKLECVAVPLNVRLSIRELEFQLTDSGSKLLFTEQEFSDVSDELERMVGIKVLQLDSIQNLKNESVYNMKVDELAPYIIC